MRTAWAIDGMDLPGGVYRDIVKELLEKNKLIESELVIKGRHVDLDAVDMLIVLIVGTDDAFIPPGSYRPLLIELYQSENCPNSRNISEVLTEPGLSYVVHNP